MSALPGYSYRGTDPNGYMTAAGAVTFFDAYRAQFDPPVHAGVTVRSVHRGPGGFCVDADNWQWACDAVVVATGSSSEPRIPPLAADLPRRIEQLSALRYRRPADLDDRGGVLVVGASASGVQIADEIARSGRAVTIAVGEHVRLPRSYRGLDIYDWMDRIGQLDERYDEVDDVDRARRHASVQVVGSDDRHDLDLNALRAGGVHVVGRLMAVRGSTAQCSGALANLVTNADLKQARLLRRIDEFVDQHGLAADVAAADEPRPTRVGKLQTELDLAAFSTVIWATGYRPRYPWLMLDAFDRKGRLRHDGGVCAVPGLYVLGLPFMRRRRSNLISGLGPDAVELFAHMRGHLDHVASGRRRQRPTRAKDDVLLRACCAG
jgi:putative flavoprotein involved in K+ transport